MDRTATRDKGTWSPRGRRSAGAGRQGGDGGAVRTTNDAQATFDELESRGVEFTSEPTRMPYGIDAPFRDPFGNEFRMVQELDESGR